MKCFDSVAVVSRVAAFALLLAITLASGCAGVPNANLPAPWVVGVMRDDVAQKRLDRELNDIASTPGRELSSIATVVIRNGAVVYEGAVGRRFIDPADATAHRAATPDTLFRIASTSKVFVAIAVAKLVDEGALDLDRDVADYVNFSLRNPNFPTAKISLRMLLTHTSSLRDDEGYNFPETVSLRDVLLPEGRHHGQGRMWAKDREPGGHFAYCNLNFGVIATVLERVTNERFDRLMQRIVFAPMAIAATFDPASLAPATRANVATLYRKRADVEGNELWNSNGPWLPQVDDYSKEPPKVRVSDAYMIGSNGSVFAPHGGLRISARDLGKVMLMLMNDGIHEGTRLLSKRAIGLLLSEQWRYDASALGGRGNRADDEAGEGAMFNAWSLGLQKFLDSSQGRAGDRIVEGGGFSGVGHFGSAYGLTSAFIFDPVTKNGMIFLVGGIADDPETDQGAYSALYRYEERILTGLYRGALKH